MLILFFQIQVAFIFKYCISPTNGEMINFEIVVIRGYVYLYFYYIQTPATWY